MARGNETVVSGGVKVPPVGAAAVDVKMVTAGAKMMVTRAETVTSPPPPPFYYHETMNTAEQTGNGTAHELHGRPGAPVVAFVHGLGLNRGMWRAFAAALSGRYRVLVYDLFGHGGSAPPPGAVSLSMFSLQLQELLDALGVDKCAIAGFSLGGMINRRFALDFPESVTALAIFNSPHKRSAQEQKSAAQRAAQTAKSMAAALDATMARWFTPEFRAAQPETVAQVRQWVMANDPAVYAGCRRLLVDGVAELTARAHRSAPPLARPALVMTCENDVGSTPAMSHAIAAEIPGAQARIVPGLRHLGLVERPAEFTGPLLQFLDRAV